MPAVSKQVPAIPAVAVRKATAAQARTVAHILAAAFFDDPVVGWMFPDRDRRRTLLPDFFELEVANSLAHDQAYTTPELDGAALWVPPAPAEQHGDAALDTVAEIERATQECAPAVLQLLELFDEHRPQQPHWYLPVIATRPDRQGRGVGSALLAAVLEGCDSDSVPAYLEATTERNQALYRRHGFDVVDQIRLPGGPPLWPMWRDPQPPARSGRRPAVPTTAG